MQLYEEEIPLLQEEVERLRSRDRTERREDLLEHTNLIWDLKGPERRKQAERLKALFKKLAEGEPETKQRRGRDG